MKLALKTALALLVLAAAACSSAGASTEPGAPPVDQGDGREPGSDTGTAPPAPADDRPPAAESVAITSTTPANGAKGVFKDAKVSIVFTKPMKAASVQAAYSSADLSAASVAFEWNAAGDTLTITPNTPLAYAIGDEPATTQAKSYAITIGGAAEAQDGTTLGAPHTFTFSTLRMFTVLEGPIQAKTRTVMANGTVHNADIDLYAGDSDVVKDVEMRAVVTFALSDIPENAKGIESATFKFNVDEVIGDPFGLLAYYHISNENVTAATFSAPSIENAGYSLTNDAALGERVANVEAHVWDDVQHRAERFGQSQFRVAFPNISLFKVNNQGDSIRLARSAPTLTVQYLVE